MSYDIEKCICCYCGEYSDNVKIFMCEHVVCSSCIHGLSSQVVQNATLRGWNVIDLIKTIDAGRVVSLPCGMCGRTSIVAPETPEAHAKRQKEFSAIMESLRCYVPGCSKGATQLCMSCKNLKCEAHTNTQCCMQPTFSDNRNILTLFVAWRGKQKKSVCNVHQRLANSYCKTCQMCVCDQCVHTGHNGISSQQIATLVGSLSLDREKQLLNKAHAEVGIAANAINERVKNELVTLKVQIDAQFERALQVIEEVKLKNRARFESQIACLKTIKNEMEVLVKYAKFAQAIDITGEDFERVLNMAGKLSKRIEHLERVFPTLFVTLNANVQIPTPLSFIGATENIPEIPPEIHDTISVIDVAPPPCQLKLIPSVINTDPC